MTTRHNDPPAAAEADASVAGIPDAGTDPALAPAAASADQLAKVSAEATEFKDLWLRAKAETDNVRKQAQADVAKAHKFAIERFAEDLLPVKDALEQTLAAGEVKIDTLKAGAELTLKALQNAFAKAKVSEINPLGEKFDPHRHQAMQMVAADQPANTVVSVFQKGYLINDRVLRPALVTVAKAEESAG
jgi:molecular chaperone GrpE